MDFNRTNAWPTSSGSNHVIIRKGKSVSSHKLHAGQGQYGVQFKSIKYSQCQSVLMKFSQCFFQCCNLDQHMHDCGVETKESFLWYMKSSTIHFLLQWELKYTIGFMDFRRKSFQRNNSANMT